MHSLTLTFNDFLQSNKRTFEQSLAFCSSLLKSLLDKKDLFFLGYINDNYINIKMDDQNISEVYYDVPKLLNTPSQNPDKSNACFERSSPEYGSNRTGDIDNKQTVKPDTYIKSTIYSLGTIFRDLFSNKDGSLKFTTISIDKIKPLIATMLDKDPDKRPNLNVVIETIEPATATKPTSKLSEDTKQPITPPTTSITTLSTTYSTFLITPYPQQTPYQYVTKADVANFNNNTSQPHILSQSISSSISGSETRSNTPSPSRLKTRSKPPSQVKTSTSTSSSGTPLLRSSSIIRSGSVTPVRQTFFVATTTSTCQQLNNSNSTCSRDDLTTTRR
jgi:hypothetical protein